MVPQVRNFDQRLGSQFKLDGGEHVPRGQNQQYDHARDHHQRHVERIEVVLETADPVDHDEHHQVHDDATDQRLDCQTQIGVLLELYSVLSFSAERSC